MATEWFAQTENKSSIRHNIITQNIMNIRGTFSRLQIISGILIIILSHHPSSISS